MGGLWKAWETCFMFMRNMFSTLLNFLLKIHKNTGYVTCSEFQLTAVLPKNCHCKRTYVFFNSLQASLLQMSSFYWNSLLVLFTLRLLLFYKCKLLIVVIGSVKRWKLKKIILFNVTEIFTLFKSLTFYSDAA